ncbi:MAG: hypothetical protein ACI4AM_01870 [Muribaculaceae bacterium]
MKKHCSTLLLSMLPLLLTAQNHNWQPLGQGTLCDAILPAFFGVEAYQMPVDILQDADNPAIYAVKAPFGEANPYYDYLADYLDNDGADGLIVFDATDPDNVIIPPSVTGLVYENEPLTVNSYTYWESAGMFPELTYDGRRGTLANGSITFAAVPASLWITTASLDALDMGFTPKVDLVLRLPGAADYSLELALASWCLTDDGRAIVAAWPGDGIARVIGAVCASSDTDEQIAYVQEHPTELPRQQGAYIPVPDDAAPAQRLYIVALGYDADNQLKTVAVEHVYTPDNADGWTPVTGLASITDFLGNPAVRIQCAVEESVATPGLLRLVNPMAQSSAGIGHISGYANHSDYLYLDTSDPDCVIIFESPLGITLADYGDIRITSDAAIDLANGRDKTFIAASLRAGIMTNRLISFPESAAVRIGAMTLGSDTWLRIPSADIIIDLSQVNSITDPEADQPAAPAIYYAPDGRRLPAPSSSSITLTPNGPLLPRR